MPTTEEQIQLTADLGQKNKRPRTRTEAQAGPYTAKKPSNTTPPQTQHTNPPSKKIRQHMHTKDPRQTQTHQAPRRTLIEPTETPMIPPQVTPQGGKKRSREIASIADLHESPAKRPTQYPMTANITPQVHMIKPNTKELSVNNTHTDSPNRDNPHAQEQKERKHEAANQHKSDRQASSHIQKVKNRGNTHKKKEIQKKQGQPSITKFLKPDTNNMTPGEKGNMHSSSSNSKDVNIYDLNVERESQGTSGREGEVSNSNSRVLSKPKRQAIGRDKMTRTDM